MPKYLCNEAFEDNLDYGIKEEGFDEFENEKEAKDEHDPMDDFLYQDDDYENMGF